MLLNPHPDAYQEVSNAGLVGSQAPGTAVTSGAAANTKGAVAELISAANNKYDSFGIYVWAFGVAAAATTSEAMLDILAGAATEEVLIPNLLAGFAPGNAGSGFKQWFFPLYIPAGTRISARVASARLSTAFRVGVHLIGGAPPPWKCGRKVTTYGTGTVPNGINVGVAASGGAATETEITAATTEDHFAVLPSFQVVNDTTIASNGVVNVGIGIGPSPGERVGFWQFLKSAGEEIGGPFPPLPIWREIPSGTRLSMLCSGPLTADASHGGVIHAVS
jgi:hypothetical protein